MRALLIAALAMAFVAAGAVVAFRGGPSGAQASSHREAPLTAEDPTADQTDVYAFRSPDKPNTVTLINNVIPGEDPAAGPNWYTFSPSARYDIYVDRNGDGKPDVSYYFRFKRNTGPHSGMDDQMRTKIYCVGQRSQEAEISSLAIFKFGGRGFLGFRQSNRFSAPALSQGPIVIANH